VDDAQVVRLEGADEKDDTMGHRTVAELRGTGKKRVKRGMRTGDLLARRTRRKDVDPGTATPSAPTKRREEGMDLESLEVVFSDLLEIIRSDGTRVRGGCALRHRTREMWESHAILTIGFDVPDPIWHRDHGKQEGAAQTRQRLLLKGFLLSMSRAGTPPEKGDAERCVGLFTLAVADRRPSPTPGPFLRAAEA
jgi:transposase InsO family protein